MVKVSGSVEVRGIEELVARGSDPTWSKEDRVKYKVAIRAFLWGHLVQQECGEISRKSQNCPYSGLGGVGH